MCKTKRDLVFSDLVRRSSMLMVNETDFGFGSLSKRASKIKARANNNNNNNANNCGTTAHTTTTTSIGTYMTTPRVTCLSTWTHACYHYSSVMRVHSNNPDMNRYTCWATPSTSAHGLATSVWGMFKKQPKKKSLPGRAQHHWDWGWEWTEDDRCDRDEWPPRAFWQYNPGKKMKEGQFIRLVPYWENQDAGLKLFKTFCLKHDGWKTKGGGVTEINEDKVSTTASHVNSNVNGGTTTYTTSYGIQIPNAVFEINVWEHSANPLPDDALWVNPCWPSTLLPNDPGWALLTDDPWYQNHAAARASTHLYNRPPPNAVTSGKTRSHTYAGNPKVAVRDLEDQDLEADMTMGLAEEGDKMLADEHGHKYEDIMSVGMDFAELDDDDYSVLVHPPGPTEPMHIDVVPSGISDNVEICDLEDRARPGSSVDVDAVKPTGL